MKILQITDTHLYGNPCTELRGVTTDATLHAVLADAFAREADYAALLVTGDLVQDDGAGYRRFAEIFSKQTRPVLCIPGNHDEPAVMRRELSAPPFRICGAHEFGDWQLVMLDSYDPGCVGGRLAPAELARLDAALAASKKHAMVCLHHHPVAIGSRWLDAIGLADAHAFWRVLDAHAHVRAVTWGHVHQVFESRRGAVRLFGTPSTCAQFLPNSDRYALDSGAPAYRSFSLHSDGGIDSEVHWVEPLPLRQAAAL